MKLSVIIPTRNRAKMLKNCLNSLVRQTKKSDEVLIIDNNSNDNTKDIVLSFKKKLPIKYLFEPRIGIPIARNTGIKNAHYDIIAFIDDDCSADKNWIKNMFCIYIKKPEILVVQGKTYSKSKKDFYSKSIEYLMDSPNHQSIDTKNLSFRKDILNNHKSIFDENFPVCEDMDLYLNIKKRGIKVLKTQQIIAYHHRKLDFVSFSKQQFISGKYAYLLKQKHKNNAKDLPKDLQNIYFLLGSLCIMPFIHTFRNIKTNGFKYAIKLFPIIIFQKIIRYSGFFAMRFIKKRDC
ncbi:MAG: glycosyltransferase [Nanoarchaeota archaeon]